MLCFSIDSPATLENVQSKWTAEIAAHCEGVKLILVALKCDLRESQDDEGGARAQNHIIGYEEGVEVAKAIGAVRYLECSAKHNRGVNEAFTEAARVAIQAKAKGVAEETEKESSGSGCCVM